MHNDHDKFSFFPEYTPRLERFLSKVTMTQSTSERLLFNYTTLATESIAMTPASRPELSDVVVIIFTILIIVIVCILTVIIVWHRRRMLKIHLRCLELGKEKK